MHLHFELESTVNAPENHHRGEVPLRTLTELRDQLHQLVPALTVGEGDPEMAPLLATVRTTTSDAEALLAVAEPIALTAIRAGLEHAAAGEHNESRTEFLTAYHRLSVLLHKDQPRRVEAAHEPTKRWRPAD